MDTAQQVLFPGADGGPAPVGPIAGGPQGPVAREPDPQLPPGSIVAQTADGMKHVFPAGTPDEVIDRTIMSYVEQSQPGYQQARADAQKDEGAPGKPNWLADRARALENGLSANSADRIEGGLAAAGQYLGNAVNGDTGRPTPGQAYAATRDVVRQQDQQFQQSSPYASFGYNLVGGLPVGGLVGKIVGRGATLASQVGRSVVAGGATGAAYGAGANKDNPVSGALQGGAVGVALGAGAPFVARGAESIAGVAQRYLYPEVAAANKSTATQRQVDQYLSRQLGERSAADLANDPAVMRGAPVTTAEALGRNAMGDLASMARRPGDAPDLVTNALAERQFGDGSAISGSNARLLDSFGEATGIHPTKAQADLEGLVSRGREDVNPAYAAIRADTNPVSTPTLDALAKQDKKVSAALAIATQNTRNAPGAPDASLWLKARQVLAEWQKRDPVTGVVPSGVEQKAIEAANRDLGTELENAIPGYKDAQAQAALYKAPQGAYDRATGMLFGSSKGKSVADTQKLVGSLQTPEEFAAARRAFATDLMNAVNRRSPTTQLLTPGAKQKMSIMFGPDAAKKLADAALDEKNMTQFFGRAAPGANAITSEAMMRAQEMDSNPLVDAATHGAMGLFHGGVEGAVKGAGASLLRSGIESLKRPGQNEAFRNMAAEYLTRPASEFASTYSPSMASTTSINVLPGTAHATIQGVANLQGRRQ